MLNSLKNSYLLLLIVLSTTNELPYISDISSLFQIIDDKSFIINPLCIKCPLFGYMGFTLYFLHLNLSSIMYWKKRVLKQIEKFSDVSSVIKGISKDLVEYQKDQQRRDDLSLFGFSIL